MADERIRVFLLVQNRLLREGLERLLRKEVSIELVGASSVDKVTNHRVIDFNPDILVVEGRMLASQDSPCWSVSPERQNLKLLVIGMEPEEAQKCRLPSVVFTHVPWEAPAVDVVKAIRATGRFGPIAHADGAS
jgi:hypothetical protein